MKIIFPILEKNLGFNFYYNNYNELMSFLNKALKIFILLDFFFK